MPADASQLLECLQQSRRHLSAKTRPAARVRRIQRCPQARQSRPVYRLLQSRPCADLEEGLCGGHRRFRRVAAAQPHGPANSELSLRHLHRDGKIRPGAGGLQRGAGEGAQVGFALTSRGNAYLAKGDLNAALDDYNLALKLNPNYVRAYTGRGQLFEKRGDTIAARYDYRSASAALTKFDEIDTGVARRIARQRLDKLIATAPAVVPPAKPPSGMASTPTPPSGPRKVALIVGNGAYTNVPQLDNPQREARFIATTFRDLGFQTVTLAPDLTRDRFFTALREFGREAEKADWAVVYYAGHGMEIGGVNYLIPTDAMLAADHDAETQAVALEQVIASVAGAR